MIPGAAIPGIAFSSQKNLETPSPLRSDIAGFVGRTRRGPSGRLTRIEGWRDYHRVFGGLSEHALLPYAIRGYFENGGQTAYVMRLVSKEAQPAQAEWCIGDVDDVTGQCCADTVVGGFTHARYRIIAKDPGAWASSTRISVEYRREGLKNHPELDWRIQVPDEPVETLQGIDPKDVVEQVNLGSRFIYLSESGPEIPDINPASGPRWKRFDDIYLEGGGDGAASLTDYQQAVTALGDQPEVAFQVMPDLYSDLGDPNSDTDHSQVLEIQLAMLEKAQTLHDRLVLLDAPPKADNDRSLTVWLNRIIKKSISIDNDLANGVVYYPAIWVSDPFGEVAKPLKAIPPSGHVAGLISRLDRELGPQHTPANRPLLDAVDLTVQFTDPVKSHLYDHGINLLRCIPAKGLSVWGGRTISRDPTYRFVAHRRLIHRLVRAIRRVAEPLVFEVNGPELWLAFVRAVTTVLLQAYRSGGLVGETPEQAFQVRCDETINSQDDIDNGRCLCEIRVAPAVPMEFIVLLIALSRDGTLQLLET